MGTTTTSDSGGTGMHDVDTTLVLPADLGIEHAASLKALLLPALAQAAPVRLDAAAAGRLHAATLQLLVAFCRDRRDGGLQTQWVQVSASLREAAAALGLNDLLQLSPEPA